MIPLPQAIPPYAGPTASTTKPTHHSNSSQSSQSSISSQSTKASSTSSKSSSTSKPSQPSAQEPRRVRFSVGSKYTVSLLQGVEFFKVYASVAKRQTFL